ncbi:hypothetical protein [Acidianus infernus]|uniref:hypothetical protein n=1 Tax=Acidianus infernus TaxID=12915 RepID=UPI003593599B
MIALADYELISIRPGILIVRVENEELKVRIFPIPIHVIKSGENYSVQINMVISVDTNSPKFGEPCSPQNIMTHKGVVPKEVNVIRKPEVEINVEGKEIRVYLEITNLVVYPDFRDSGGSPCVMISWVLFQTVK